MIVSTRDIDISGYQAIELTSDAADTASAMRDIDQWCKRHNSSRSALQSLVAVRRDGGVLFTGLAYPAESTVELGKTIYRNKIATNLSDSDTGKVLAIDFDSEDYAIAYDEIKALDELDRKHDHPRVYLMRVGYSALAGVGATVPRTPR